MNAISPLLYPRDRQQEKINGNCFRSVLLQAVTDHSGKFVDNETGSGKCHYAFVFQNVAISQATDHGVFVPGN